MTFNDIDNLFRNLQSRGLPSSVVFEDVAQAVAQQYGDPEAAAIASSSPWKNRVRSINAALNRGVNATGADEFLGDVFGKAATWVGVNEETGRQVGQSLPRAAVDMLPMAVGSFFGPVGAAAGMALTSASSGLNAFGETGSLGSAALGAAAPYLGGALYKAGETAALNYAARSPVLQKLGFLGGTPTKQYISRGLDGGEVPVGTYLSGRTTQNFADRALGYAGGQAAANAGFLGLDLLEQGPDAVLNKDYLFANVASNIPFLGFDLTDLTRRQWVGRPTEVQPTGAPPEYTAREQRTLNFQKALAGLETDIDRDIFRQREGFDIASEVVRSKRLSTIQTKYEQTAAYNEADFTNRWGKLQDEFLGLPSWDKALEDPTSIAPFEPAAKLLKTYQDKVKQTERVYAAELSRAKRFSPSDDVLLTTADELNLKTTVLAKPVEERTFDDYKTQLGDRLPDDRIKILLDTQRAAAGLAPLDPELWKTHLESFVKKSKKPAAQRIKDVADATAAINATKPTKKAKPTVQPTDGGKVAKPRTKEEELVERIKVEIGRGKTQAEAIEAVMGGAEEKVQGALERLTKKRQVNYDLLVQRIGDWEAKKLTKHWLLTDEAWDKLSPEDKLVVKEFPRETIDAFYRDLGKQLTEATATAGDEVEAKELAERVYSAVLNKLERVAWEGKSPEEALRIVGGAIKTTRARFLRVKELNKISIEALEAAKAKVGEGDVLPGDDELTGDDVEDVAEVLGDGDEEVKEVVEEAIVHAVTPEGDISDAGIVDKIALELLNNRNDPRWQTLLSNVELPAVQKIVKRMEVLKKGITTAPDLVTKDGKLTPEHGLLAAQYLAHAMRGVERKSAQLVVNEMRAMGDLMRAKLWKSAVDWDQLGRPTEVPKELEWRFAKSGDGEVPLFGVQKLVPMDEFADIILTKLGYGHGDREVFRQRLVENFKVFNAPETRFALMEKAFSEEDVKYAYAGGMARMGPKMRKLQQQAREMQKQGRTSREIRAKTGWFYGKYDKMLRWEIPDEGLKLKPIDPNLIQQKELAASQAKTWADMGALPKLGDLIEHDALFEAYPMFKNIPVTMSERADGVSGWAQEDGVIPIIGLSAAKDAFLQKGGTPEEIAARTLRLKQLIMHELQHGIQMYETFMRGGSPSEMTVDRRFASARFDLMLVQSAVDAVRKFEETGATSGMGYQIAKKVADRRTAEFDLKAETDEGYRIVKDVIKDLDADQLNSPRLRDYVAYQLYRRIAGEQEAREVESRLTFDASQRKISEPFALLLPEDLTVVPSRWKAPSVSQEFGELPAEGVVYGAALQKARQVFLNEEAFRRLPKDSQMDSVAYVLAHENAHVSFYKATKGEFGPEVQQMMKRAADTVSAMDPQSKLDMEEVLRDMWLPKEMRDLDGVRDVLKNVDGEEWLANANAMLAAGLWKKGARPNVFRYLPLPVARAFDWVVGKIQDLAKGVQLWAKLGGDRTKVQLAKDIQATFDGIRKYARKAESEAAQLGELLTIGEMDILDKKADVRFAVGRFGPEGASGRAGEVFNNWVVGLEDLMRTYKPLQAPGLAMLGASAAVRGKVAKALTPLFGHISSTGKLIVEEGPWHELQKSPALLKTANKLALWMQKAETTITRNENGKIVFDWDALSPELRGEIRAFTPKGQSNLAEFFIRLEQSTKEVQKSILENEELKLTYKLARMLNSRESMAGKWGEAESVAKGVMDALVQQNQVGLLEAVRGIPDDTDRQATLVLAQSYQKLLNDLREFYDARPWFVSLRRFGKIQQVFTKGDQRERRSADTPEQAKQIEQEMTRDGWKAGKVEHRTDMKDDSVFDSRFREIVQKREAEIKETINGLPLDESVRQELLEDMDFTDRIEREAASRELWKPGTNRKIAEGSDRLNLVEQHLRYTNAAVKVSHMKALSAQIGHYLTHPDLAMYASPKETFKKIYDNFRSNDNDFGRKLAKANAAWFIGFNLPGHFAELAQPVMTHWQELRAKGVGVKDGLKMLAKAEKDITQLYKNLIKSKVWGNKETDIWKHWPDKDEADMLKRVIEGGFLEYGQLQQVVDQIGFGQEDMRRLMNGEKRSSFGEKLKAPFNMYSNVALNFYSKFTQHNGLMGFLNGYRTARKNGMKHDDAVQEAIAFEATVNKSGGRASRQAGPFSGNGVPGYLFYALQRYTTGWFGQLARYYRHGWDGKNYPDLSQKERSDARSAFKLMVTAQLGAAGMFGFPFMAAGITLMEDLLGEDIKGEIYKAVDEATSDPLLGEAATHGMVSSMAQGLGIPADFHSRFALGGFLGFNSYDGFSGTALLGPTASMVESLWKFGKRFAQEKDLAAAFAEGGPSAVRSLARTITADFKDKEGRKFTAPESALAMLGFRGADERKAADLRRIQRRLSESSSRELALAAQRVRSVLNTNPQVVQQRLQLEANKLLAGLNPSPELLRTTVRDLARKVADTLEDEKFPQDIREIASPKTADALSAVAAGMGFQPPESQPYDREMTRMAAYQAMGLTYRPQRQSLPEPGSFR